MISTRCVKMIIFILQNIHPQEKTIVNLEKCQKIISISIFCDFTT